MRMNRSLVVALCVIALGLGGGLVHAAERIMVVDVPFDFTVDQGAMSAGAYEVVAEGPGGNELLLRDKLTGDLTRLPVLFRLADTGRDKAYLVFDSTSEGRFLSEIHLPKEDGYAIKAAPGRHDHVTIPAGGN